MKTKMNLNRILLLMVFCLIGMEGFGLDSLMTQRLSVPRAGDIYLIQEPNDSFSFFQIGNADSTELIPIMKGAFLVKDSFLHARTVKKMETNFPNYFDTSDIYSIPRKELHQMNRAGKIAQIYRNDRYEVKPKFADTSSYSFYLFMALLFFLINAGLGCLYYLIIWLCNKGERNFIEKDNRIKLLIVGGITLLTTFFMLGNESEPIDYQELLFLLINNLGVAITVFALYQFVAKYLYKRDNFLLNQLFLFLLIIFGGGIIILLFQSIMIYLIDHKFEVNLDAIFEFEIYNYNVTFGLFNFLPLAISNSVYNFIQHQKKVEKQQKDYEITRLNELKTKAELEALTAKTNPHFLYNSLNTIAALAKTDADKTEKMAIELSKFLKYSTNRKGTNLVTLEAEIEMVNTYLKIEKIRFEDQLTFQIEVSDAAKKRLIPRFLLQPLVENALKHGYQIGTEQIELTIIASIEAKELVVQIKDSGAPFADDFTAGYGLDSVTKKLHLLFPNRHQLELLNTPEKQIQIRLQDDKIIQDGRARRVGERIGTD